jgi:hypothetical protein
MSFLSKNKYLFVCCISLIGLIFITVYKPAGRLGTPEFPEITTSERTYNLSVIRALFIIRALFTKKK